MRKTETRRLDLITPEETATYVITMGDLVLVELGAVVTVAGKGTAFFHGGEMICKMEEGESFSAFHKKVRVEMRRRGIREATVFYHSPFQGRRLPEGWEWEDLLRTDNTYFTERGKFE